MAEPTRLPGFDPTTAKFLAGLAAQGGPPLYTLTPAQAREVLRSLQAAEIPKAEATIEDRTIPGGPTGRVAVRLVRPRGARGELPVILYTHGGGWILGDRDTHDRLIREIAVQANAQVVFVNYDPSPEARFPVPIEQAFTALQWAAKGGDGDAFDTSRLAVVGDSVGGHMAAVLSLLAKQRGGPRIDLQVLVYPVTNAAFDTPSYEAFADGPWLTREAMKWFWNAFCPDVSQRAQPTASPLRAPDEMLRGLPPAFVLTNEYDVLRDEGEAYAHRLAELGVAVSATRCLGAIHDFLLLNPLADTPTARGALRLVVAALRETFATGGEGRAARAGAAAEARH